MTIRSGRYSTPVPATAVVTKQVIFSSERTVYRIFHSTDRTTPLKKKLKLEYAYVDPDYVSVEQDLHPTMSIDVAVGGTDTSGTHPSGIRVTADNQTAEEQKFSWAWDLVRGANGQLADSAGGNHRSGRFNLPSRFPDPAGANAMLTVKIVDLTYSGPKKTVYRVSNTGELSFMVLLAKADKSSPKEIQLVGKHQSIDIELPIGARKCVFVKRIKKKEHIKGIFDIIQ